MIDLSFILTGAADIPADHGYHLYAAVSRLLPSMHEANGIGIHPIRGRLIGERRMQLCDFSRLTIRVAPGTPKKTCPEFPCNRPQTGYIQAASSPRGRQGHTRKGGNHVPCEHSRALPK